MIHRALLGSMERFFGVLIEHYAGDFPTWFAPIQVAVLPISKKHVSYAEEVSKILKKENVYVEIYNPDDTLSKRIRNAETQKIPYILVVGDKEKKTNSVNIRKRHEEKTEIVKIEEFTKKITKEIKERA